MNLRTRSSVLLIGLSLLLAGTAALVANRWMSERAAAVEASRQRTVRVVAAATDIPFGTLVEDRHLTSVDMLSGTAPRGAYAKTSEVAGKVARADVFAGEILTERRLVQRGEGSTLAAVVAPNMRAVTVRVDNVVGVAGFLLPGNRVDVVAAREENRRPYAETILTDVRVLAVDQQASADKSAPVVVRAVTLEVTPEGALAIARARQVGSLQLTLRNPHDGGVGDPAALPIAGMQLAQLPPVAMPSPVLPVLGTPSRPRRASATPQIEAVTVIRGTSISQSNNERNP